MTFDKLFLYQCLCWMIICLYNIIDQQQLLFLSDNLAMKESYVKPTKTYSILLGKKWQMDSKYNWSLSPTWKDHSLVNIVWIIRICISHRHSYSDHIKQTLITFKAINMQPSDKNWYYLNWRRKYWTWKFRNAQLHSFLTFISKNSSFQSLSRIPWVVFFSISVTSEIYQEVEKVSILRKYKFTTQCYHDLSLKRCNKDSTTFSKYQKHDIIEHENQGQTDTV